MNRFLKSAFWGLVIVGAYHVGAVAYRKAGIRDLEVFANKRGKK